VAAIGDSYMPNGILRGWRGGYIEFVWTASTYALTPWTSTNGRTWSAGPSLNAAALWKAELKKFSADNKEYGPFSCSFEATGWAEDGQALILRGRLMCPVACGSVWYSTELMLVSETGASWTAINEQQTFGAEGIGPISGGDSGFVGLGLVAKKQVVWTSRDGQHWTQRPVPDGLTKQGSWASGTASVTAGLVVAGVEITTKADSPRTLTGYMPGPGLTDCSAGIAGVSPLYAPAIYTSADGTAWSPVTLPGAVKAMNVSIDMVRIDDRMLVARENYYNVPDDSGTVYWMSADGVTWTETKALDSFCWNVTQAHQGGLVNCTRDSNTPLTLSTISMGRGQTALTASGDVPVLMDPQIAIGPAGVLITVDGRDMYLGTLH
jgi:hypothetical protein